MSRTIIRDFMAMHIMRTMHNKPRFTFTKQTFYDMARQIDSALASQIGGDITYEDIHNCCEHVCVIHPGIRLSMHSDIPVDAWTFERVPLINGDLYRQQLQRIDIFLQSIESVIRPVTTVAKFDTLSARTYIANLSSNIITKNPEDSK